MKYVLAISALCLCVTECGKKDTPNSQAKAKATLKAEPNWVSDLNDPNNVKIEAAIRKDARKPTGELTKADLRKVTRLVLYDNKLTDVKGLEKLTQLEVLYLHTNQLTDVKGLEQLTRLEVLSLNDNKLTEIPKVLENLTQLKSLNLSGNKLADVKGLENLGNLTQLKILHLSRNQLTDVKGLEQLTKLEYLWLEDNPDLTKAQIAELQKALPKCRISHNATK